MKCCFERVFFFYPSHTSHTFHVSCFGLTWKNIYFIHFLNTLQKLFFYSFVFPFSHSVSNFIMLLFSSFLFDLDFSLVEMKQKKKNNVKKKKKNWNSIKNKLPSWLKKKCSFSSHILNWSLNFMLNDMTIQIKFDFTKKTKNI